jgi:germination protein YpeB
MYSIVIIIIGAIGVWGMYQYKHSGNLRQELDNQYNRAFFDMAGYVRNVEVLLVKSLITSSPQKTASTLQEAWRQSNLAQYNLGQLPISSGVLSNTSKFLTQVGDFSYSMNNQNMQGKPLSDKQYKTLEQLHDYAVKLGSSLSNLQGDLSAGRLKWGELSKKGSSLFKRASTNLPSKDFENIDKTFQTYPTLIYDGPFSDHISSAQPKGITGDQLTIEQAKQKVGELFKYKSVKAITETGKNKSDSVKTYGFKVTFNGVPDSQAANVDVTQKGGHVYWMLMNRPAAKAKLNIDEAKAAGKKYLEKLGYSGMEDTYYLKEDNTATINYAYKQNNVIVYPDLIKVKVALDNGEIVGIESKGYLYSHSLRSIPKPKVTEQQALSKINKKMQVLSSGLSIIPTDYKTELFTYEFKGKLGNNDFLVYINAETGREENILMIVDTDRGILTF